MKDNIVVKTQGKKQKISYFKELGEWIFTLGVTILVTLFITGNVFAITVIDGESMEPTFHHKDRVFNYKLDYMFSEPKPGDIVILSKYKSDKGILVNVITEAKDVVKNISNRINNKIEVKYIIKRVIAVSGDTLDIKDGYVYLNGNKLEEDYIKGQTFERSDFSYPIIIPENHVFVLGDNRENSLDSRIIGLIEHDQVKGKVVFRLWPFHRIGKVK